MVPDVRTIKGPVGQLDPKVLTIVPIAPAIPPKKPDNHIICFKRMGPITGTDRRNNQ